MTVLVRKVRPEDLTDAIAIIERGMRDNPIHVSALGSDTRTRTDRLNRMFALGLPMRRPVLTLRSAQFT